MPAGYQLETDPKYIIKRGDLVRLVVSDFEWCAATGLVGSTVKFAADPDYGAYEVAVKIPDRCAYSVSKHFCQRDVGHDGPCANTVSEPPSKTPPIPEGYAELRPGTLIKFGDKCFIDHYTGWEKCDGLIGCNVNEDAIKLFTVIGKLSERALTDFKAPKSPPAGYGCLAPGFIIEAGDLVLYFSASCQIDEWSPAKYSFGKSSGRVYSHNGVPYILFAACKISEPTTPPLILASSARRAWQDYCGHQRCGYPVRGRSGQGSRKDF